MFINAENGTLYNKLFRNHMDTKTTFMKYKLGVEYILTQEKSAYYGDIEAVLVNSKYSCDVSLCKRFTAIFFIHFSSLSDCFGLEIKNPFLLWFNWHG